jgi:dTDP-4-amino-4,6-dideoxygalactose transaminase
MLSLVRAHDTVDVASPLYIPSLPVLDPRHLGPQLKPQRRPRFPLDRLWSPSSQLFYLARAGVHHTIRHWLAGTPGTVLMPAYHHGVEVQAVRAAGAAVRFYRVDRHMRIDLDDLAQQAKAPDVRIVYLTHFVGFAQPAAAVREIVQSHHHRLFEDCALALFSRSADGTPLGSLGDAACFCLYKSLPVPHGGLLLAPGVPTATVAPPPLLSTLHHLAGQTLAHLELHAGGVGRWLRRTARAAAHATVDRAVATLKTGTDDLSLHELGIGAAPLVVRLLPRFDHEMVVVRRRRNFERLAAALDGVVEVVGGALQPGACPLFVPVRVARKRALLAALRGRGIDAIDFWSRGDRQCDLERFPEVAELRREVLELPCHQSLDDAAIDGLAHAVKQVLAHA